MDHKTIQEKYRNLCVTINNYSGEEYQNLLNHKLFKYVIMEKKIGKQGTSHLQGYAELMSQMRFNAIKGLIHSWMHFERRYGSQAQAIERCKKEKGTRKIQGESTDLLQIREQIKSGVSQREILETYEVSASQLRVIDRYYTYLEEEKRDKPNVY